MTSTKANLYNSLLELVSFIGGQGCTTYPGSPTMFNNDEVDSPLKTNVKVQIGVNLQVGGSKGKGVQEQCNLHFEENTSCPQEAHCTKFQERCMEMVVTQDCHVIELLALLASQLFYIQIFYMFD
jgi:hypothetical protein